MARIVEEEDERTISAGGDGWVRERRETKRRRHLHRQGDMGCEETVEGRSLGRGGRQGREEKGFAS